MNVRPLDTSPEAERIQIEIFRTMDPEKRLRKALELMEAVRSLLAQGVRNRHPDYNDEQIRLAVIRLMIPKNLFLAAYPNAKDILP